MTQQHLSEAAEVSTRHLSCLETGKATPSRQMVLLLGSALDLPLRERNALLLAAGYAPAYAARDLDGPELAQVRQVLGFLMKQAEPYGAIVADHRWDLLMMNRPMRAMMQWLLGEVPSGVNLMHLTFDPHGLRPFIRNFDALAPLMIDRLVREADAQVDGGLHTLVDELLAYPGTQQGWRRPDLDRAPPILVPLHLAHAGVELSLFTTLTTLGTALDVTLQELRIEMYFPADDASDLAARQLATVLGVGSG